MYQANIDQALRAAERMIDAVREQNECLKRIAAILDRPKEEEKNDVE